MIHTHSLWIRNQKTIRPLHFRNCATALLGGLLVFCGVIAAEASTFDVYVASFGNGTVYQVPDTFGGAAVGAGQVFASGYASPYALTTHADGVYVGQLFNGQILRNGSSPANLFATSPNQVYDMSFADAGNLHVVGGGQPLAHVFNSNGVFQGSYNTGANGDGIDYAPSDGVYVAHVNTISRHTGSGTGYVNATSPGLAAQFFTSTLQQIVKGPDGFLYTSSYNIDNTIFRVDPLTGATTDLFPSSTVVIGSTTNNIQPVGLDIGPDNKLYFTDWFNFYLYRANLDGSNPELVATGFVNPVGIDFSIPEPSTAMLLAMGGLLAWRRSRGKK